MYVQDLIIHRWVLLSKLDSIVSATIEQSRQIEVLHGVPAWREMFRGQHLVSQTANPVSDL